MQFLLPGLLFILITVALLFFVLPSIAPFFLFVASGLLLAYAIYAHYKKFGVMEYERATWMYNLRRYASLVLIAVVLIGGIGFWTLNREEVKSNLPTSFADTFTSPAPPAIDTQQMGGAFHTVMKTASSRIKELMRHGRISI